jgi:hypothetical protein
MHQFHFSISSSDRSSAGRRRALLNEIDNDLSNSASRIARSAAIIVFYLLHYKRLLNNFKRSGAKRSDRISRRIVLADND